MLKLTRLNNQPLLLNPDHIQYADASPDTTLTLISGDRILVRESLDELIEKVVAFRRLVRNVQQQEGDALPVFPARPRDSECPSYVPRSNGPRSGPRRGY